jgi:two-component system sensor histidine kinase YesM
VRSKGREVYKTDNDDSESEDKKIVKKEQQPVSAQKISKRQSLVTKVGAANGVIFLVACFITLFITLFIESGAHIHKDIQMMDVYISNTLNSVDNSLKDMGRVSLICFSDNRTQEIIKNYHSKSYKEQLADMAYLGGFYTSLVSIRNDISGIYITDENSVIYSQDNMNPSHPKNTSDADFIKNIKEKEKLEGNISGCKLYLGQLPEYLHYQPIYRNNPYKDNCIYLVRPVRSFSPYKEIGHIAIITPITKIKDLADQYLDPQMNYLMIGDDGRIICSQDKTLIGERLEDAEPEMMKRMGSLRNAETDTSSILNGIMSFNGVPCIVTAHTSDYSKITLLTAKPIRYLIKELLPAVIYCVLCSMIVGIAAVLVSYRITRRSLFGLLEFSDDMSQFEKNNLSKRYHVEKTDEVGILKLSFNKMMDYINELVINEYQNKVKIQQAELMEQNLSMLYLKSQINPHFLYNTLDMIRIHAALNNDMETSDILMQLVTFYRLSTRVESALVSFQTELDMIDAYMTLMKFRYMSLVYRKEVTDGLAEVQIPNFILQPLIENSLLHGLRNRGYYGQILLTAEWAGDMTDNRENRTICIKIIDDGVGMEEDQIEELNQEHPKSEGRSEDDTRKGHIGIRNVQSRLKIYYGTEGSVHFSNNDNGGVTVTILLKEHITQGNYSQTTNIRSEEKIK